MFLVPGLIAHVWFEYKKVAVAAAALACLTLAKVCDYSLRGKLLP